MTDINAKAFTTACLECDLLLDIPALAPGARVNCPRCATWTIVALGSEEADRFHRFSTQERVPSDGYAGLVEAHYRLAEALSTEIANSLRTIAEGRKAATL